MPSCSCGFCLSGNGIGIGWIFDRRDLCEHPSRMSALRSCSFEVLSRDGAARRGRLVLAHGEVSTPAFMPVGTLGAVKGMLPENVAATGAEMVLANAYHLMLRPGAERIAELGGLHRFSGWSGPILTDSGGYQIHSLAALREVDEEGASFRSHVDGSLHRLTPERAVEVQDLLGSDVVMVLDECVGWPASRERAASAMERSMRWAERSRAAFRGGAGRAIFGIQQGGTFGDLRAESSRRLIEAGFDGYAIGGLAVGEPHAEMLSALDGAAATLPEDRPRYLMGVGKPADIVGAVLRGVDLFDCVLPTRSGRNGQAFTRRGVINLRNARHAGDPRPLDPDCDCRCCTGPSRAYLHHLVRVGEIGASMFLTWHNLHYYQELLAGLREAISAGTVEDYAGKFADAEGDLPVC